MSNEVKISQSKIYLLMLLMLITGSCNTIFNKLLNEMESLDRKFTHFFFQTFMMFIGETICLIAYYIIKPEVESDLPPINVLYLIIPATLDFCASTIMSFSLTMMAASVYQMTRGSIMIFTAIFSVIFLKTKLFKHEIFSLMIIFVGLFIVGFGALTGTSDNTKTSALGVITLIIAQLFAATDFVVEETILKKYRVHPLQLTGWEGVYGMIYYSILLSIFYHIKCDVSNHLCYVNQNGEARLEDFVFAIKQLKASLPLCLVSLGFILSIAVYNFAGLSISKYVSSSCRAVMDNARTVVIWLFFLLNPYIPNSWREVFIPLQLVGFVFLVFGTIVYNRIIVLPYLAIESEKECCDEDEKKKMIESEKFEQKI
jgi:drug/metabolite transporter (DMT)-like permease